MMTMCSMASVYANVVGAVVKGSARDLRRGNYLEQRGRPGCEKGGPSNSQIAPMRSGRGEAALVSFGFLNCQSFFFI